MDTSTYLVTLCHRDSVALCFSRLLLFSFHCQSDKAFSLFDPPSRVIQLRPSSSSSSAAAAVPGQQLTSLFYFPRRKLYLVTALLFCLDRIPCTYNLRTYLLAWLAFSKALTASSSAAAAFYSSCFQSMCGADFVVRCLSVCLSNRAKFEGDSTLSPSPKGLLLFLSGTRARAFLSLFV